MTWLLIRDGHWDYLDSGFMRIIGTANSIVSQKNRSRMWIPGMHGTGPGRGWPFLVDTSIYGGRGDKGRWPRRKRFLKARSCHQYTKIAQHCQTYNNFWFYGFWGAHCTRTACKFLADKAFFSNVKKPEVLSYFCLGGRIWSQDWLTLKCWMLSGIEHFAFPAKTF